MIRIWGDMTDDDLEDAAARAGFAVLSPAMSSPFDSHRSIGLQSERPFAAPSFKRSFMLCMRALMAITITRRRSHKTRVPNVATRPRGTRWLCNNHYGTGVGHKYPSDLTFWNRSGRLLP